MPWPLQLGDLAHIPAPTLVMAADDDVVSITHLEAMCAALPQAQLAIILGFLADDQVTKLMPTHD
jgi:pimeloyl-ACP methyl ester carboxylesterase